MVALVFNPSTEEASAYYSNQIPRWKLHFLHLSDQSTFRGIMMSIRLIGILQPPCGREMCLGPLNYGIHITGRFLDTSNSCHNDDPSKGYQALVFGASGFSGWAMFKDVVGEGRRN